MPMGPLDIIRTQEASQLKHIENQRTQHAQGQASKSFQTMVENQHNKPIETTKTENTEYRYDAKEKGNNQYYENNKKRKQNKEEKKETKDSKSEKKSSGFDILI